ncbi:hypothetical protein D3C76_1653010 [compost metagenome]
MLSLTALPSLASILALLVLAEFSKVARPLPVIIVWPVRNMFQRLPASMEPSSLGMEPSLIISRTAFRTPR